MGTPGRGGPKEVCKFASDVFFYINFSPLMGCAARGVEGV